MKDKTYHGARVIAVIAGIAEIARNPQSKNPPLNFVRQFALKVLLKNE